MGSHVSTAREALMAELLQDADAIVRRFEQADQALAGKIEKATTDAAGKAFLAAKLNFESVIDKNAEKLTEAGRHAAAQIGNQLNSGAAQLVAANAALESKARRFVLLLAGFAFVAGVVGGFVGARLAGMG
ncbi:putative membrane protein (plasmid) [Xanthomonas euvesicatoria pv. vesicatoria str. 85-10]|nr:putative membrane protein [Xanthomonas euvesicatoria pv. vesicatoria str. 85-10]